MKSWMLGLILIAKNNVIFEHIKTSIYRRFSRSSNMTLFFAMGIALIATLCCEARIKLVEFKNESPLKFNSHFCNGKPIQGVLIDEPETCLATEERDFRMVFEDAGRSGFHRPHWKFHIWLEKDDGFSFLGQDRFLYAVVFYDGEGEISVRWDKECNLHIKGGYDVKDILYPWAKGTIGRGNPYHEIQGVETDSNGIRFFDYNGFVGYPSNRFVD